MTTVTTMTTTLGNFLSARTFPMILMTIRDLTLNIIIFSAEQFCIILGTSEIDTCIAELKAKFCTMEGISIANALEWRRPANLTGAVVAGIFE